MNSTIENSGPREVPLIPHPDQPPASPETPVLPPEVIPLPGTPVVPPVDPPEIIPPEVPKPNL